MRRRWFVALAIGAALLPAPAGAQVFGPWFGPIVVPGTYYSFPPAVYVFPIYPLAPLNSTGLAFRLPVLSPYTQMFLAQQQAQATRQASSQAQTGAVRAPGEGGGYGGTGERFYLEPGRERGDGASRDAGRTPSEATRESLRALAQRTIRVQPAEPGYYRIEWIGETEGLVEVEFRALDAQGQLLRSRVSGRAPFRGLLRVPEETAFIVVVAEKRDGSVTSFRLPIDEFRALAAGG